MQTKEWKEDAGWIEKNGDWESEGGIGVILYITYIHAYIIYRSGHGYTKMFILSKIFFQKLNKIFEGHSDWNR
jgi:hypothetical protein